MFLTIILKVKKRFGSFKFFSFVCFFGAFKTFIISATLKVSIGFFRASCFHTCGSFDVHDCQGGINDEGTTSVSILP